MREENPEAYELATTEPMPFFALFPDYELRASGKIFSLDRDGDVVGIRYCECCQAPPDLPEEKMDAFYDMLRYMAELVQRDDLNYRFTLRPGDCLVFDNQRVLHGRTGYTSANVKRWLRDIVIDRETFHSKLRVLGQKYKRKDFHLVLPAGTGR